MGSSQNWTIFRGHFYAFWGLFLRSWYRMGIFFWVAKISNNFLGCLEFLIFFGGRRVDAGPKPTYEETLRVPPPPPPGPHNIIQQTDQEFGKIQASPVSMQSRATICLPAKRFAGRQIVARFFFYLQGRYLLLRAQSFPSTTPPIAAFKSL